MKSIEIYTGPGCGYCDRAKAALRTRGLDFVERDVSDEAVLTEFRKRLPRVKAIPQIFVDGMHIGGFDDLMLRLERTD